MFALHYLKIMNLTAFHKLKLKTRQKLDFCCLHVTSNFGSIIANTYEFIDFKINVLIVLKQHFYCIVLYCILFFHCTIRLVFNRGEKLIRMSPFLIYLA